MKKVIPAAAVVSFLLMAAVSGAFSGSEFCQIEVKAETQSGYSFDDPAILFEVPNEYQVGFYLDSHWGCFNLQEGIPLGEAVFLMLKTTLLITEGYPKIFGNATLVVSDNMGNVVWTKDMGPCGFVWNEEMEKEYGPFDDSWYDNHYGGGSGFHWIPDNVGNYTAGVIFEGLIYDVPSDYSNAVSIGVYQPGPFVGTVTDGETSAAISNASVEAFINGEVKASTTTDSEGFFNLQLKEVGVYDVRASALGYTPVVQRGVNTELEPKQVDFSLAPISLAPNFTMSWRVTSGDNRKVIVDSQGNIIVASESETRQTAVSKFGPKGNLLWRISEFFSGASEIPRAIAVDSADNILLLVESRGAWCYNLYTTKLDPDGNRIWKESVNTGETDQSTSLAVDSLDNVIVIGVVHSKGKSTLVKYTSDGDTVWSKTLPIYFDTGEIVTDSDNNIILGGMTSGSSTGADYYVAKLDGNGNLLWEKTFDCKERKCDTGCGISMDDQWDYGYAVALDSSENVIVTGNKITVKLGPDGSEIWLKYFAGDDLVVDLSNNIFVVCDSVVEMHDANGLLLGSIDVAEKLYSIAIHQNNTLIVAGEQNVMKLCLDGSATTHVRDPTLESEPADSDLNTSPENTSDTTSPESTPISNPDVTSPISPEPSQGTSKAPQQANDAPPVSAFVLIASIVAAGTITPVYFKKHKR